MPVDFNSGAALGAGQLGLGIQEKDLQKQQLNQQAIESSGQPIQGAATEALKNQLDMVTVTPQLAAGLKTMSGDDSADRMIGMKVKSNILAGMIASITRQKTVADIVAGRLDVANIQAGAGQKRVEKQGETAEDVAKIHAGATVEAAEISGKSRVKSSAIRADSKKGSGGGSKDLSAQKALLAEYHRSQSEMNNPFSTDDEKAKAKQFMSDNQQAVQQALQKIKETAQVSDRDPNKPTGSDQPVPLNNKLPGLE